MELHQRLLLSGALLLAAVAAPAADFENLARLAGQGARVSAAVWDLDADRSLAQFDATQRLTPASLSKIIIAAAALETWAPDKTFVTEVRGSGTQRGDTLAGDLVLRGGGDATLDETTLWALAAQLRAIGIKRVTGRIVVERAPFGELGCDSIDRCGAMRRSARAYNAAPSAIGVNYGSWCVAIRATTPGQPALVSGCATGDAPIAIDGRITTVATGGAVRVDRTTDERGDRLSVGGTIGAGEIRQLHRAMSDPAAGAGLLLHSILRQTGVTVEGEVETIIGGAAGTGVLLARVEGLPLQEQVGRMMRWSNNYIADVLTMGVALQARRAAPPSLADASLELVKLVRGAALLPAPENELNPPLIASGSGLTTENRLSAMDFLGVLRRLHRDTRRFPAFYGSFVVPRDASFEYLRRGGPEWLDRVALKTGSLTQPVSVNGIAGYLRKKSGGWMAFAIIVNGSEKLRQIPHDRALGAARADVEALLQRY